MYTPKKNGIWARATGREDCLFAGPYKESCTGDIIGMRTAAGAEWNRNLAG